jgi:predicted metal-dependent hydrolase
MNEPSDSTLPSLQDSLKDQFHDGIRLFNGAQFFEAHEALEDVWRGAPEPQRKFLQGLIQIAVALHHHSRGNLIGCRSLLQRGIGNLAPYPELHFGLELAMFRDEVELWRKALESESPLPTLPVLRFQY